MWKIGVEQTDINGTIDRAVHDGWDTFLVQEGVGFLVDVGVFGILHLLFPDGVCG